MPLAQLATMHSAVHEDLAASAQALLGVCGEEHRVAESAEPKFPIIPETHFPPFSRPTIQHELTALGCSTKVVELLEDVFVRSAEQVHRLCQEAYLSSTMKLRPLFTPEDAEAGVALSWIRNLLLAFERNYRGEVRRLQQSMVDEVRAAQLRHSASPPPPPPPASDAATITLAGHFNPAITALLQSAYDARATGALPNKGERRELARATGLSEKQVVTWVSERPRLWKIESS